MNLFNKTFIDKNRLKELEEIELHSKNLVSELINDVPDYTMKHRSIENLLEIFHEQIEK